MDRGYLHVRKWPIGCAVDENQDTNDSLLRVRFHFLLTVGGGLGKGAEPSSSSSSPSSSSSLSLESLSCSSLSLFKEVVEFGCIRLSSSESASKSSTTDSFLAFLPCLGAMVEVRSQVTSGGLREMCSTIQFATSRLFLNGI